MIPLLLACGTPCPRVDDSVDYSDDSNWICRPGEDDLCATSPRTQEVLADGSLEEVEVSIAEDPPYDCFYVYPTVDLRAAARVHEDLTDVEGPEDATEAQALWLRQHCRVYVPNYRQATFGNYFKKEKKREPCFEVAYEDVERAWEHYLETWNEGRPVVLYGHSQGGQITSRLFRERDDEQVVAAYPIGWPVDAALQCEDAEDTDCLVSFKSFLDGDDVVTSDAYAEGEEVACVDPSDEGLVSSVFRVEEDSLVDGLDAPVGSYLVYRDAYTAECVSGRAPNVGLRIGWLGEDDRENPVPMDHSTLTGSNASHILDVQFVLVDLGEDMDRRVEAFTSD